jgi:DNA-binding response OmpR family regulator
MVSALPPRVLLVMTDQWPRALLRAALREGGYDAVGTRALAGAARLTAAEADRGPVGLVILAQEALAGADRSDLDRLREATDAPIVLLAPAGGDSAGPWVQVVHRPVSIGELVRVVEALVPLPADGRRPLD